MSPAPILVVCHEATRTGAVRVAADLLTAVRDDLPAPLAVRLLTRGPLAERLESLAHVDDAGVRPVAVVVNSALAADALHDLDPSVPALVYVHEAEAALRALPSTALDALRRPGVRVLCVSDAAAADLVALGVDATAIGVLPPVVAPPPAPGPTAVDAARQGATHLVVGCGEVSWRKGTDLFLDVSRRLAHRSDVAWAWVGRRPRGYARLLDRDESLLGRDGVVRWAGELPDASAHLAAADVFLLPSRDDPQPLVTLEAAHLGTPTVGFDHGGLADLAASGAAEVVPYPDTVAMAAAVERVLDEPARAAALVDHARERAAAHGLDVVAPRFLAEIRRLVGVPA